MPANDYAIRARFEAKSSPGDLMRWLDTPEGIAAWWSDTVEGAAGSVGDTFTVRFPSTSVPFELEVTRAEDASVEWKVPESPPWWKGTTIRFEVAPGEEGGANLLFVHEGFEPDDPIIAVITPAWVRFVDNLVQVAETGQPNPAVVN